MLPLKNFNLRLFEYSAIATTMLALNSSLEAQIIHVDVNPDLLFDEDIFIDFDSDGINDFRFTKSQFGDFSYSSLRCYSTVQFGAVPLISENGIVGRDPSYGTGWAYRLSSGYLINSSAPFVADQYLGIAKKHRELSCVYSYNIIEDWNFSSQSPALTEEDLLLGFRLNKDYCFYNGWMRYALIDTVEIFKIIEYAYNLDCGSGIYAGQLKSDVTTVTATYSSNLISVNIPDNMINADISIYNMSGQRIFKNIIENINTTIPTNIFVKGIYVIVVENNNFHFENKLSIY